MPSPTSPLMLGLSLHRSPRQNVPNLPPQAPSASRLKRSASVPKFASLLPPPRNPATSVKKHNPFPSSSRKSRVHQHNAPYPLSYEKSTLNCDALDNQLLRKLRKSSTWVDFQPDTLPKRCLDLGCGTGAWILDAAKEWPDCEFIGFDLVDIQYPPQYLGQEFASRVKWVHGSFLKRLPFEDGYFDHVHIRQIARGVPEDKWDWIMAEVTRVLRDGGTVELFEEDIIFPVLPRSSTATPRQRERKRSTILRPSASVTKHHSIASLPPHDHAVLEVLFYRVFERRFINLSPTALIMRVLETHLRGAGGSPLINFPLPRAPPLLCEGTERADTPRLTGDGSRAQTPMPVVRDTDEETLVDTDDADTSTGSRSRRSGSGESTPATSVGELEDPTEGPLAFYTGGELVSAGCEPPRFIPEERLAVTEGTLGINLYRSWQGVMSCREALWEEYCDALQHNETLLAQVGWEDDELKMTDRERFEVLLARYKADMEARYPISDALVADLHWTKPPMEVSKEDAGERREVAEARSDALRLERSGIGAVPEASRVCRKGRVFVASKGGGGGSVVRTVEERV